MPKLRAYTSATDVTPRIRRRVRGGPPRYYADFRDFEDVGGTWEKLVPPGQFHATTDFEEAKVYAEAWLAELIDRRNRMPVAASKNRTFGKFAAHHLAQKAINKEADGQWLKSAQLHLEMARDYFGEDRDLAGVQVSDVTAYVGHLRKRSNGRGDTMSSGTIVHYLNSVSNMFDRAIRQLAVRPGDTVDASVHVSGAVEANEGRFDHLIQLSTARRYALVICLGCSIAALAAALAVRRYARGSAHWRHE